MNTVTTSTETVNGLTLHLTNHGDHVTAIAETSDGSCAHIIAEPQQARDGSTVWKAHLWYDDELVTRSPYTATAATAVAAAFQEFEDTFVDCFQCGKLRHENVACDPCGRAAAAPEHWSVAAVRTATANAVATVASLDGASAGDDGMPWSLDLWPNRVTAEHTLAEWDAVAGGW